MKVAFLGSPPFAAPIFEALLASDHHQVCGLVTPPDRPRGRGRAVVRSPLAAAADEAGVPVLQPESTKAPEFLEALAGFGADVLAVASYGEILRQDVLDLCPHGALNVHASLLPRWRGASPIQRAIAAGDGTTGVSIQRMVLKLDAGDVLLSRETPIGETETAADLFERLSHLGAEALLDALGQIEAGTATYTPQDDALVTLAPKLSKEDGHIDFGLTAAEVARHVRAMTTWPGARTFLPGGKALVVLEAVPVGSDPGTESPGTEPPETVPPGTITLADAHFEVRCAEGAVRLTSVKPAGKGAMAGDAFLRGARLASGDGLGVG